MQLLDKFESIDMPVNTLFGRAERGQSPNINRNRQFVVITTCTDRKRVSPLENLRARKLRRGKFEIVSRDWNARVADASSKLKAEKIYCGRTFVETTRSAEELGGDLWIISAGMGLIQSSTPIPSYSLTTSPRGEDAIGARVLSADWSSSAWWSEVTQQDHSSTFVEIVRKYPKAIFLVALSENYALMIAEDLRRLDATDRSRLRLFGANLERALGEKFAPYILPYDRRIDGPDSPIPGTASDFSARSLRHFTKLITEGIAGFDDVSADRLAVGNSLEGMALPNIPKREPKKDAEIRDLIIENWAAVEGRSGRMLRYLRDNLGVACEQGRFRRLFNQVSRERVCEREIGT